MEKESQGPTINDALLELAGIESQLHPTGAVDYEPAALMTIRRRLEKGEISPEEAIQSARLVIHGRQDYH